MLAVGVRLALPLEATMFRLMKTVYTVPRFLAAALHWVFLRRDRARTHTECVLLFSISCHNLSKARENEKSYLRNRE